MKIIFLDIDGVLYTTNYYKYLINKNKKIRDKNGYVFDPKAIKNFNDIINSTNAKIVISSTWRRMGLNRLKEIFKERNIKGDIIDITPISTLEDFYFCRGEEIEKWLTYNGVPDKLAIIDDSSIGDGYFPKHFFKTKFEDGITEEIKEKIIIHLNS